MQKEHGGGVGERVGERTGIEHAYRPGAATAQAARGGVGAGVPEASGPGKHAGARGGRDLVGVGWLTLALSPLAWLTLSVGAAFLSLGGALMGQLYATLHDVMARDGVTQPQLVNTTIRTGWSFGFVFGPSRGAFWPP